MEQSDVQGIYRSGEIARRKGHSYWENPFFAAPIAKLGVEGFLDWADAAMAWASGWVREDAGRDLDIKRLRDRPPMMF